MKLRYLLVVALFGVIVSLPSGPPRAEMTLPRNASPTDVGGWYGTWYHKSRDFNMAIWIREDGGVPDIKVRYFSLARPESFETDWSGQSVYRVSGGGGSFSLVLGERDQNRMKGRLDWELDLRTVGRGQHGEFVIYRTGDGRSLNVEFEQNEKVRWRGDNVQRVTIPEILSFRKASKRHVLWEELPI